MSEIFIQHIGTIICDEQDKMFILSTTLRRAGEGYIYARRDGEDMGLHRWIAKRAGWNLHGYPDAFDPELAKKRKAEGYKIT